MVQPHLLRVCVLLAILAVAASSQEPIYSYLGDSGQDEFGHALSPAGDVNGDGVDDFIVGSFLDDKLVQDSGSAYVYSGLDGSLLYQRFGSSQSEWFGHSVGTAGDLNLDGYADFIVGADQADLNGNDSGAAFVYSGVDGALLYTFQGDDPGDYLGLPVRCAGDVNLDGYPDLIIGMRLDDDNGTNCGGARVFSGFDGSTLYTFHGDSQFDQLGHWVDSAGDVDADGYADLLVGSHRDDPNGMNSGSTFVYSGMTGALIYNLSGESFDDRFGRTLGALGDLDADGYDDFIVGAQFHDFNGPDSGQAKVFSGFDGSVMHLHYGDNAGDTFGHYVAGGGDVNGDGTPDYVIGANHTSYSFPNSGSAIVYSGANGALLYRFDGHALDDQFGKPACLTGDVNSDGLTDLLIGAHKHNGNGTDSGLAEVYSGNDLFLNMVPRKVSVRTPMSISVAQGDPGQIGLLFLVEVDGIPVFLRMPILGIFNAQGRWTLNFTVQNVNNTRTLVFQAFALVSGGGLKDSGREALDFIAN
jgi:hypothetical protein